ncbi:unnamed protein product [Vicia faba]|uniref:Uncharacterized protein n=1 Tax=Vicia faba TaxID=3906 RepID=A0AAV1AR60_VICFA|nr:unnamed protein product [Vicia faba]
MWKLTEGFEIMDVDNGFFIVKCEMLANREKIVPEDARQPTRRGGPLAKANFTISGSSHKTEPTFNSRLTEKDVPSISIVNFVLETIARYNIPHFEPTVSQEDGNNQCTIDEGFKEVIVLSWNIPRASNNKANRYMLNFIRKYSLMLLTIKETHIDFHKTKSFWDIAGYTGVEKLAGQVLYVDIHDMEMSWSVNLERQFISIFIPRDGYIWLNRLEFVQNTTNNNHWKWVWHIPALEKEVNACVDYVATHGVDNDAVYRSFVESPVGIIMLLLAYASEMLFSR